MTSPIVVCDFDECQARVTTTRGAFQFCPQHAAEHDALTGPALAAWKTRAADAQVLEHPLQALLTSGACDLNVREYSGRAMYGAQCLAVVGGSLLEIMAAIVEGCLYEAADMAPDDRTDIEDAMRQMRTDAMGHDTVVYWPSVPYCRTGEEG